MTQEIAEKLNELSEVQAAIDVTRLDYEAKRAEILRPVQDLLNDLDAKFKPLIASAEAHAETLTGEIKTAVLAVGVSVKGERLQAVYAKGRDGGFDTKALAGYAAAHPEINQFKKPDGEPSVRFVSVK